MRIVFLLFSIQKIVWPADANKIANLDQHLKSLGTADVHHWKKFLNILVTASKNWADGSGSQEGIRVWAVNRLPSQITGIEHFPQGELTLGRSSLLEVVNLVE